MKEAKPYNTVKLLIFFNLILAFIAFIKDIVLAAYFGTSNVADAINLAFFLADTIGNNLIGAAISVASIPVLTKLLISKERAAYLETVQKLIVYIFCGTSVLMIIMIFLSEPLFHLFHLTEEDTSPRVLYYFYMLSPIIVIAPCWLFGSSIMQASKRFILPAVTPIFYNVLLFVCLLICAWTKLPQIQGGTIFCLVLTGATVAAGSMTWFYVQSKQKIKWNVKGFYRADSSKMRKIFTIFTAYFFILLFGQAALLAERFFASTLEPGTISALSYAYRIAQFPQWVFIAAINTFILPTISVHMHKRNVAALKRDITKSFLFVIFVSAVLSFTLVCFSEPLIKLVLGRGSFDSQSVKLTSTILKGYGLSIVGQSLFVFCTRYFVAEENMGVPFTIGLTGSLLNVVLLKILVPRDGPIGIGYAVAIASTLNGVLILAYFIKNLFGLEQRGEVSNE